MPKPDKKRRMTIEDRMVAVLAPRLIRVRPGSKKKEANSDVAASKHPPMYMVLEHRLEEPAYSIVEVAAGAIARPLLHTCAGMSFAAVRTQYGPRIVGVGVELTTIYDPKTATEVLGPCLSYDKLNPVLIPHGGKLYALTRSPSVVQGPDFVPWFFVLDLSTVDSMWDELPPPPIFPCRLNPLEYRNPPKIRVAAYAVVGSHILLSVEAETQQDKGTCAFDMDAKHWEMVDDKNLPFVGQAVPLGDRRFIARSRSKGGADTVYHMEVFLPGNTNTGKTELSIVELSVASEGTVLGQLLCSMGKDSFSSFDIRSLDPSTEAKPNRARVVHHTYSLVSGDDGETNSVVKEQRQIFKIRARFTPLSQPSPVAAALTMEDECI